MPEKNSHIIINFFARAAAGLIMVFFINQFLVSQDIDPGVGLNPVTFAASGVLGAPGVALLYGISFYQGL